MKLWYDNVALHEIGIVSLMEESSTFEPAGAPQKEIVTLQVRIDVWLTSFTDNRAKMVEAQQAIRKQERTLRLVQETLPSQPSSTEVTLYDQHAHVVSDNFPQDINEWGTTHQQIRVTFQLSKHNITSNALTATYTPTGGTSFPLGNVFTCKERLRAERFDKKRDIREHVEGEVTMRGEFLGDMAMTLTDRRNALIALKEQWKTEFTRKQGTLSYAGFNRVVRIDELDAEIDQPNDKIIWGLTAHYTRFPNEAGYAGCDYEVSLRKGSDDGENVLAINGRVLADSKIRAEAKLVVVRTAVLSSYSFTAGQLTKDEVKERKVGMSSFNGDTDEGDGEAFVEIIFSLEYKKRIPDHLSWTLTIDDQEDAERGTVTRTYSGSVTCGFAAGSPPGDLPSESDKAFWIAATKARELGENKHPIRKRGGLKRDDRLTKSTGAIEFVKVDFSYTYEVIGGRLYVEMKSEVSKQMFGEAQDNISGFIVGGSQVAVEDLYATLKVPFTNILRNESTSWSETRVRDGSYPALTNITLADLWSFTPTTAYSTLLHRLDFSFSVFRARTGTYAIKYALNVDKNYTALVKTTVVEGSLFGTDTEINNAQNEVGANVLDSFLSGLALGTRTMRKRDIDREFVPGITGAAGTSMKLDFSETFESKIAGDDTILQCEVNESIVFSGDRNVIIPIPDRKVEIQKLGKVEGRRTISGFVVASNETAALKWVKKTKGLAFGSQSLLTGLPAAPAAADIFEEPPQIDILNTFIPFTNGEVREDSSVAPNVVKVSFRFNQILPAYAYTTA